MRNLELIATALAAGLVLGSLFFGGLWWTVNRGVTAALPAVWFGLSTLLRGVLAVGGLYSFARFGADSLLACLCGFVIARSAVKHLTRLSI